MSSAAVWRWAVWVLASVINVCCVTSLSFSPEELQFFASLNLCSHFGGESCLSVCPHRYIRHRFGVPLCPQFSLECCLGPPAPRLAQPMSDDIEETTTTTTTTTSTRPPTTTTTATAATTTVVPDVTSHRSRSSSGSSCGMRQTGNSRHKRIVGGVLSSGGRWPWLAALRSQLSGAHTCSGALISPRWVLTAAHCFKFVSNPSLWNVKLGEFDLLQQESGERNHGIEQIVLFPGYRVEPLTSSNDTFFAKYVHDIALLKLSEPSSHEHVCLPTTDDDVSRDEGESARSRSSEGSSEVTGSGDVCWVAGWGATRDSGVVDQKLREVSGDIVDSESCGRMWGAQLHADMLCFGNGTYGPCAGDSGGPLSCCNDVTGGGACRVVGVVSWGTHDCDVSGYPSVFTHVSPYVDWIRNITAGGE